MALSYTNVTDRQIWAVDTATATTYSNVFTSSVTAPTYPVYADNAPYVIYQQPYQPDKDIALKQVMLAAIEARIDEKIEELRSLDREGLLKEMLIITEQQLDSLRSAPRYEAPKEIVVDKRQMELPLEMASDTLPF